MMKKNNLPKVSVIIPVFNGEKYIKKCLDHITKQDYPQNKLEVLVVDNGSSDGTVDIIKQYDVSLLFCKIKGPSAARNAGIEHSKGDLLVFIDADCLATPSFIMAHAMAHRHFEKADPRVKVIGGGIAGYNTNFWSLCDDFCSWASNNPKLPPRYVSAHWPTANISVSREVVDEVGGFNIVLKSAEDVEFCKRISEKNYRIYFEPSAKVQHMNRENFSDIYKRMKNWANIDDSQVKAGLIKPLNYPIFVFYSFAFISIIGNFIRYGFMARRFHIIFFLPFIVLSAYLFCYNWIKIHYTLRAQKKLQVRKNKV